MNAAEPCVLFAAAEVTPFAKAGGLADVVGALPKELAKLGIDVRVVLPKYRQIDEEKFSIVNTGIEYAVLFDGIRHIVRVFTTTLPNSGVPVYLLDHPHYEGVGDIYYQDITNSAEQQAMQVERFLFFSAAITALFPAISWWPNILHAHDWHTAFLPVLCQMAGGLDGRYRSLRSVYTIHNLALQGWIPAGRLASLLGLHPDTHAALKRQKNSGYNLARVGMWTADAITTVSPTYAKEIMSPEFGAGLEDVLREREGAVVGILNGIDADRFNPATDRSIIKRYDAATLPYKAANVAALKLRARLEVGGPVFGLVTRLTQQKGVELVVSAFPRLAALGCGLVVLGSGEREIEHMLRKLAKRYPKAVSVTLGFDPEYAQRIYAGSDLFLMPSRFEPCGLGQMIAMRYGTIPVVRATGGLRDTVTEGQDGTGFLFGPYTADALYDACVRAVDMFHRTAEWRGTQSRAMRQDLSWAAPARRYVDLYRSILSKP